MAASPKSEVHYLKQIAEDVAADDLYVAAFEAVAVVVAQDVFEIVAPATASVRIAGIKINQYTDFGDVAAEILSVRFIRGFTTAGSGGAAVTPRNLASGAAAAAGSTVTRNNTTLAQNGTSQILVADGFNVAAGWSLRDALNENQEMWLAPSERGVLRINAPVDSLTMNGMLLFEEVS